MLKGSIRSVTKINEDLTKIDLHIEFHKIQKGYISDTNFRIFSNTKNTDWTTSHD